MPLGKQDIPIVDSLNQLARGGLPIRARLRLGEEAGPNKRLFTSDLSVNEFLLAKNVGCVPISQVMGSSIYHIGRIGDYKGSTGEIQVISDAHRTARQLALHRLWQEAKAVAADAVIAVRLDERLITKGAHGKGGDDGDEVIEFTVVGTAVQASWITHPPGSPVVTDLSGQDLWALAQDGYVPCGLVFDFCRYHVFHVMDGWSAGGEVTGAADGVNRARNIVAGRVLEYATKFGAEFVIGSDIHVKVHEVPCGFGGCHRNDLDIDVSWFGTGIVHRGADKRPSVDAPPLILGMMPLGRKRRGEMLEDGEDESKELEREAEEEEKRAAEESERGGEE